MRAAIKHPTNVGRIAPGPKCVIVDANLSSAAYNSE